ncbi:HAMP domain-containing protein [Caenimonas sedimenti]|uniref:Sensor protein n=1 Tax=Caenimonas sedimenti TaxID=2596921 RepID=A0A562ZWR2_9BURK|nr:type IV pili methyl-accepting chemotaxis transducer N-terminal domain-containing protein [Caenimonas sedimenti]TWO72735.1 HAMP domain-containing protein [Caenimonas sedimenti]
MTRTASLSSKLVRIGAALLVLALASIGLTLWVTWQLEGGAAAVNEAGRLRMQTWRLASAVQGATPADAVTLRVRELDASLALLRAGDPGRPLFVPWDRHVGAAFEAVEFLWQAQRPLWAATPPPAPAAADRAAQDLVAAIDRLVSGIERQLAQLTAILNLFQLLMVAMAVASAVVVLYTGYLYVISPLGHVRQGLRRIEAGDFGTRIEVGTADEFGQVAAGFNRMAGTLQSLYGGLEAQVEAKTRRIEAQHARLAALYEVSAFLAQATTLDAMARGFAQRVRAILKAEAAVVRWSEDNERFLLVAADGFPPALCEQEHSLPAGACACGNLQPASGTRVIPIHADLPLHRRPCAEAGYAALVSVPIRLQQRLLGELNLFFRSPVALSDEEAELLDALASHLASAVEGLRAAALAREAAVAAERGHLAGELHDSIAQSLAFLKIQAQLLRTSLQRGQAKQVQATLDELDAGLLESTNDVRALLLHFRTRTNIEDIEPALQLTLQKFRHQTGLRAHLEISGQGLPLPPDVQVQVLHVLQEALSNVRKHARATEARLEVTKGRRWRFAVHDNGAGFDPSLVQDETHVGLKMMRERAACFGCEVRVASGTAGTTVELSLPEHPAVLPARPTSPQAPRHAAEALQA